MDEVGVVVLPNVPDLGPSKAPLKYWMTKGSVGVVDVTPTPGASPPPPNDIGAVLFIAILAIAALAAVTGPFVVLNWLVIRSAKRAAYIVLLTTEVAWVAWYWAQALYAVIFDRQSLVDSCEGADNLCDWPLIVTQFQVYFLVPFATAVVLAHAVWIIRRRAAGGSQLISVTADRTKQGPAR